MSGKIIGSQKESSWPKYLVGKSLLLAKLIRSQKYPAFKSRYPFAKICGLKKYPAVKVSSWQKYLVGKYIWLAKASGLQMYLVGKNDQLAKF